MRLRLYAQVLLRAGVLLLLSPPACLIRLPLLAGRDQRLLLG